MAVITDGCNLNSDSCMSTEKCEGTGAGACGGVKTVVRVRAPHTMKKCAMCVRVQTKIRAH